MLADAAKFTNPPVEVTVIPEDEDAEQLASNVLAVLRRNGVIAVMAFRGKESVRFEKARKGGSIAVIKVGTPFPGDKCSGRLRYQRAAGELEQLIALAPRWDAALSSTFRLDERIHVQREFRFY